MAGIVQALHLHQTVGLDTPVFIYHLEGESGRSATADIVFREMAAGSFQAVTSVLTLMELAVRPLQLGRPEVADEYEVVLSSYPNLTIVQLERAVARRAAELRASYNLRPADALQVAACLENGATVLLSNDRHLRRIKDIEILIFDDFVAQPS